MNTKTFHTKETLMYRIPAALLDLVLMVLFFRFLISWYPFSVHEDLVLKVPRTVYFLIVGHILAVAAVPAVFYKRGADFNAVLSQAFFQTLLSLGIFALSTDVLFHSFAGKFFLLFGCLSTILMTVVHLVYRWMVSYARKKGRNKVNIVIVGSEDVAFSLFEAIRNRGRFEDYRVLGFITDDVKSLPDGATLLCGLEGAEDYLKNNKVHELYCSLDPSRCSARVNSIIRICENSFIDFFYLPDMSGYLHRSMTFDELGGMTVIKLRDEPLANPVNAAIKRAFDLVVSAVLLIALFPIVWLFVAIGTSLTSPGPILFRQKRTGYKGKTFTMYKFRSMKVNSQSDTLQATSDDPRKTRFGDFLRRSSIDELPQLFNVFKGDMSLIGPRPHMEMHTEIYTRLVDEYLVRHMVKPGLTGWAQVSGCRGETKTVEQMAERVRHDIWYIEHWSVSLDIQIFFKTLAQIIKGDKQAY